MCEVSDAYLSMRLPSCPELVDSIADAYRQRVPGKDQYSFVIMAGGGSIALHELLLKTFPEAVFMEDAQFASAVGFLDVGRKLDIALFD